MRESIYKAVDNFWAKDFYDKSISFIDDRIPLTIPSYNGYNDSKLIEQIRESNSTWPVFICVRESQKSKYEESCKDLSNVTILAFEDNKIDDIGKTRKEIVNYFQNNNYENIFMLDDDVVLYIKGLFYNEDDPSIKRCYKYKDSKNIDHILACWQLIHQNLTSEYSNCYCTVASSVGFNFTEEYCTRSYSLGCLAAVAMCINIKKLKDVNLNFISIKDTGHDDIDLLIRCLTKNLYPIALITVGHYAAPVSLSMANSLGYKSTEERLLAQNKILYDKFKSIGSYITMNKNQYLRIDWKTYFDSYYSGPIIKDRFGSIKSKVYDKVIGGSKLKVAIVLMKGFDGCGVSRFAIEHQKELRRTGNTCDVYSFNNKYVRTAAHKDRDVIFYDDFTSVDFSSYDIFILNSYEQEFNQKDLDYYKSIKCKKVAMMHEILRQNVNRIDNVWDWIEASDIVSSFSLEMDFTKDLFARYPNKPFIPFKVAVSDADMDEMYKNSLSKDKDNTLIYYGRWTTMKDPHRLFDYKEKDPTLKVAGIGIERSIGAAGDIYSNENCQGIRKPTFIHSKEEYDNVEKDFSKVPIFPPVARDAALDILSSSLYGASFYRLGENRINNLGNRMEFAQIEISCVCLPVFDKAWGTHTFDAQTGKSFYELGNNAIYSDKDDLQTSIDEMKYLATHKEEYDKRRENIFNLVKSNYGSTYNVKAFYDAIQNSSFEKIAAPVQISLW